MHCSSRKMSFGMEAHLQITVTNNISGPPANVTLKNIHRLGGEKLPLSFSSGWIIWMYYRGRFSLELMVQLISTAADRTEHRASSSFFIHKILKLLINGVYHYEKVAGHFYKFSLDIIVKYSHILSQKFVVLIFSDNFSHWQCIVQNKKWVWPACFTHRKWPVSWQRFALWLGLPVHATPPRPCLSPAHQTVPCPPEVAMA